MGDGISVKDQSDFQTLAISMGRVLNNSFLYGPEHSVTRQSVENCYDTLSQIMEKHEEVEFDIGEGELAINGVHIELKNPLVKMLVDHMSKRDVHNFSLSKGMEEEKFRKFMEVLLSSPEEIQQSGGFTATLASSGVDHVKAKQVRYQEVAEDEVVVTQEEMEQADNEGEGSAGAESVVSFLKGGTADENVSEALKERIDDAEGLTELILQAADLKESGGDVSSAEPLSDIVVETMRRTYQALAEGDATRTKKGRQQLKKTLLLLEKQMLERLEQEGSIGDAEKEAISDAVEEMVDELEIDTLATDYMKKRKAIENNEKRILRFIKTKGEEIGDTELHEKLEAGGLSEEEWRELVSRSGVGTAGVGGEDGTGPGAGIGEGGAERGVQGAAFGAVGHLAVLLTDLQQALEKSSGGKAPPEEIVSRVHETIQGMVTQTAKKIGELMEGASEDVRAEEAAEKEGKPPPEPKLTKKQLLVMLGEIGQELCQPLAVINCSLQMLLTNALGEISDSQSKTLNLASESTDKLQQLANKMISISGVPGTLSPDAKIQESLYEKGG